MILQWRITTVGHKADISWASWTTWVVISTSIEHHLWIVNKGRIMASTTRSYCRTVIPISHFHCRRLNRSFTSTLRKAIASNIFLLVREFRGWCGMTRHQIRFNRIVYTIVADSLSLLSGIIINKRSGKGTTTCEFRWDLKIVKRRWQLLSTDNRSGPLKDPFLCFLL